MDRSRRDVAISDIAGTLLLVGAVVLAGGGLSVVVAMNLSAPAPPVATFALAPAAAGDATLRLLHRGGDTLELPELTVALIRDGVRSDVPRADWVTPHATTLRPGDALGVPLSPAAVEGGSFRLVLAHTVSNVLLVDAATSAPESASSLATPTLTASLSPASLVADAVSSSVLAVRVSHPMGVAAVASVTADLGALTTAAGLARSNLSLLDTGADGDPHGGDGVWSGVVRAPLNTTPGTYAIPIVARDVAGYASASATVSLTISGNLSTVLGNLTGLNLTALSASNITNLTAAVSNLSVLGNLSSLFLNLTGGAPGVVVLNSTAAGEGTRLAAPTSENLSSFHLLNWSYDRADPSTLNSDAAVVRLMNGGYAWSAYLRFGVASGQPSITRLEMWNANSTAGRTIYLPSSGAGVSLVGLSLNMTHPSQSGFTCSAQCGTPMTYKNADIRGNPIFSIAYMRDEGNNPDAMDLGIYSMEAILR